MTCLKNTTLACLVSVFLFAGTASAQVTLKLATLAPEGSIWMQALDDAKTEIEAATGGAIKVKIYPGGIMGSEKDVLFKIKTGQLQGGGFMGYAIGKICPDASALMFPMVFRNYDEVDRVLTRIGPFLDGNARENGFEVLGWTEVGFSYAFGMKPIDTLEHVRETKVWGLDSPMLIELFSAGDILSIPANVTDVLTSLQTGSLETVFGPPTAAVAVQWHTKVRYYNTMRLTYSIGGVFLSSAGWAKVPLQHRSTVKAAFDQELQPADAQSPQERYRSAGIHAIARRDSHRRIPRTAGRLQPDCGSRPAEDQGDLFLRGSLDPSSANIEGNPRFMSGRGETVFRFFAQWVDRIERFVLAVLVTGMVGLATVQILLRNVWHTGFNWSEPLLGMALLWLTMLGALAAAGLGRHLAIDLAAALIPRRGAVWLTRATSLFSAIVCGLLAWAAGRYVGFQREMDMSMLLGLPIWKHFMVIPVVFWFMTFRFAVRTFVPAAWLAFKQEEGLSGEGRVPS